MRSYPINAKFTEFQLSTPDGLPGDAVAVPAVKGTWLLRYGKHAYYFYNLKERKCILVELSHSSIIKPGLPMLAKALGLNGSLLGLSQTLFSRFHYGFSALEQLMLMTVPHCVTSLGEGRFIVSLWSYIGFLLVDCRSRTVEYLRSEELADDMVYGSQQWLCRKTDELYSMAFSLPESLAKLEDPYREVSFRILKRKLSGGASQTVWSGPLTDYMHDITVSKDGRFCVAAELGMFDGRDGKTIPSKVLVLDMANGRSWIMSKLIVAAHAQFDPVEDDVIYFSQHNFKFLPTSMLSLLRNATYSMRFNGPASVFKYRLADSGPIELGEFSNPEMFRLTNFQVFMHRGRKILAAMGFPNYIYIGDADSMKLLSRMEIKEGGASKCSVGTISPSSDGEFLYVQTTRSFQIVEVASGSCAFRQPFDRNHSAANHMLTSSDTAW